MNQELLLLLTQDFAGTILLIFMAFSMFRKIFKEYKSEKTLNWSRIIVFILFIVNTLVYLNNVLNELDKIYNTGQLENNLMFILSDYLVHSLVSGLGLIFVSYINHWDKLLYFPVYYLGLNTVFYLLTDVGVFFDIFTISMGLLSTILVLITGVRYRDNDVLGIGFFYLLELVIFVTTSPFILYVTLVYGIIYSIGKFKPYGDIEEELEDEEIYDETKKQGKEIQVPAIATSKPVTNSGITIKTHHKVIKETEGNV